MPLKRFSPLTLQRMVKLDIELHEEKEFYNPGDKVTGVATVVIEEEMEVRSIDMLIKGTAVCKISMTDFYECNGLDVYLNQRIRLWDGISTDYRMTEGRYDYPFCFKIPRSSISSYDGPFCAVCYYIKVVIDREGLFSWDMKKKVELKIMQEVDLNEFDGLVAKPLVKAIDQTFSTPDQHGLLDATIKLPKTGYTPGETMTAKISIKNTLGKDIIRVELILIEFVTLTAESHGTYYCKKGIGKRPEKVEIKKVEKNITKVKKPVRIEPYDSDSKMISLQVPDKLVPTSTSSPIMKVEYKLVVKIVVDGVFMSEPVIQNEIPITIGTFPALNNLCLKGVLPPINSLLSNLIRSPSVDNLKTFTLTIDDDTKLPRSVSAKYLTRMA